MGGITRQHSLTRHAQGTPGSHWHGSEIVLVVLMLALLVPVLVMEMGKRTVLVLVLVLVLVMAMVMDAMVAIVRMWLCCQLTLPRAALDLVHGRWHHRWSPCSRPVLAHVGEGPCARPVLLSPHVLSTPTMLLSPQLMHLR